MTDREVITRVREQARLARRYPQASAIAHATTIGHVLEIAARRERGPQ